MLSYLIVCVMFRYEYVFVENNNKSFASKMGGHIYHGTVDRNGIFIPSITWQPRPVMEYIFHGNTVLLWRPPQGRRDVYELRFGRLIPGRISDTGSFVPDIQGKIIAFSDYKYSVFARPIYNLPGDWVKRSDLTDSSGNYFTQVPWFDFARPD